MLDVLQTVGKCESCSFPNKHIGDLLADVAYDAKLTVLHLFPEREFGNVNNYIAGFVNTYLPKRVPRVSKDLKRGTRQSIYALSPGGFRRKPTNKLFT